MQTMNIKQIPKFEIDHKKGKEKPRKDDINVVRFNRPKNGRQLTQTNLAYRQIDQSKKQTKKTEKLRKESILISDSLCDLAKSFSEICFGADYMKRTNGGRERTTQCVAYRKREMTNA